MQSSVQRMSGKGRGLGALLVWLLLGLYLVPGISRAVDCPISLDTPYPERYPKTVQPPADWLSLYQACLTPLKVSRGQRWPLIFWQGVGEQVLSRPQINSLLARGVVQHVPLDRAAIPAAMALQAAGAPVIIMAAKGPGWPYTLLDDQRWRLRLPDGVVVKGLSGSQADPTRLDAWQLGAQYILETLQAFKDAGVRVNAVWLDFESQPLLLMRKVVLANPEVAAKLPDGALGSDAAFRTYRRQLWLQLVNAYIAAPIRSIFPEASSTNWIVTLSDPKVPVLSWDNWHHPQVLTGFRATNPVAYGIDTALFALAKTHPPDSQQALDQLYTHVLLRQVSADAWNRKALDTGQQSVPWVARRVVDEAVDTPSMSRSAYREALRHLWLRDVSGMQVFNPSANGHAWQRALAEAQDVQQVYAEMLSLGGLLQRGEVMNYQVPLPGQQGLLWSGLRDDESAYIRLTPQGKSPGKLRLQVWKGQSVTLAVGEHPVSYWLHRSVLGISVTRHTDTD